MEDTVPNLDAYVAPMADLLRRERLDDLERLVSTPTWEEYPLFSRTRHIHFLDSLPPIERAYVLFAFALPHLDRIMRTACASKDEKAITDFFAVISIQDWVDP